MQPPERIRKSWMVTLAWIIGGTLLYGVMNRLMSKVVFPGAEIIAFRPQLVIPVAASIVLGPFAGGIIGLAGNFFGDLLSGYGFQFWHWSIANFLIGFFPGTIRWTKIKEIKRVNEFGLLLLFILLGNALGLFEGFLVHKILYEKNSISLILNVWYFPALISNTYTLLVFLPPILIMIKVLKMNIETRSMLFVLLFSLAIVTTFMLVSLSIEYRTLHSGKGEFSTLFSHLVVTQFRWLGLMLIVIVIAGGLIGYYFSKKYLQPINQLAVAADKLKTNHWEEDKKIEPQHAVNEMKNLILVFNEMAKEVSERETKMKNAIREL